MLKLKKLIKHCVPPILAKSKIWVAAALFCLALPAASAAAKDAPPPRVAVSIKPLQSLAAAVMQGAGQPELIVQGAGSEHGYQLRPRDAKILSRAEIIFWAGPQMEVFLQKPLQVLAPQAEIIALADAPHMVLWPLRAGGAFEPHEHDHDAADGAEAHEEHSHNHSAEEEDLHFWLDPRNAAAAVFAIADTLARKDPARAALYRRNAEAYAARLNALTAAVQAELAPVRGRPFIVFHDAYQYFERRFAVFAAGSVTVNPEQAPGAKRLAQIRAKITALPAVCIFSEPQFPPRLVQTLTADTKARTGVLDPLGSDLPSGPDQYITLIQNLTDNLTACLSKLPEK